MPSELAEVYVDFDWDTRKVWALDIEPELIERSLLDWHLELPFFSSRPPQPLFDVFPRSVLEDPRVHPVHARRIEAADLRYPIDVIQHGDRLCILDGIHRLAKARAQGRSHVEVRCMPSSAIPCIVA